MSDQSNNTGGNGGGGGNAGLAFIVGGVVVVLAIVAYFVFAGGMGTQKKDVSVDVNLPEVSAPDVPTPAPAE
jgi:hypothetical protein